jgi:hypothetical protein
MMPAGWLIVMSHQPQKNRAHHCSRGTAENALNGFDPLWCNCGNDLNKVQEGWRQEYFSSNWSP